MKITVGQFNVKSKNIEYNFNQMKMLIEEAIEKKFEIIVFGEYALTGYGNADLFKNDDFINEAFVYQEKLRLLSDSITIIFGGVIKDNYKLYNTAIVYNKNNAYYSYKNTMIKREFQEDVYFYRKDNIVVNINYIDYLITFESDLDYIDDYKYDRLIVLDSSPVNNVPVIESSKLQVYANTVGVSASDKVVFINGGNSYIKYDGKVYTYSHALDTGIITDENIVRNVDKLSALTRAIKVWSDQTFGQNKKWVLGSSGGLDSAVTTALLAIALGSENVITYNLASKYNKDVTKNNAKTLSNKLNVRHVESSIQDLVEETYTTLSSFGYDEISTFDQENIQARTRGHLLSAFSALEDAVISNNGNKLELVLGYATMYGDTIGALSLIGDLNKVEVFQLAEEINTLYNDEIIPNNLLPVVNNYKIKWYMPPSAELKDDQVDPMKWFYHDLLLEMILKSSTEQILQQYLDNQFKDLEIGKWLEFYNLLDGQSFIDDFNWFNRTMQINHFKRLQTPPVLAYGNSVLGIDYVESPNVLAKSLRALELEKKIIEKYKL